MAAVFPAPFILKGGFSVDIRSIESTIETIASHLPEEADLYEVIPYAVSMVPSDLDFVHISKFLLFFSAGSLILSLLGRFVLGRRSSLNHSISSLMAILFVYAVTIMVYTFKPWNLDGMLSPLPFVTFFNDYMVVMPIVGIYPTVLARELLSLILLIFLVNILDIIVPQGKTIPGWYFLRFISVGLATAGHMWMHWAFNTYAPDFLVTYAPIILLLILISMLLLGFLNAVLGLILTISNVFVGAVYTFFFSSVIGKQITKAFFTAGILCVILFLIDQFGYSFVHISTAALTAYIPIAVICLILWLLIGRML